MVNYGDLNGVIPTADDLEKGEVFETVEREDLEVGEIYDATQDGDLEKRGEAYETQVPELLEPLITPSEAEHPELAANSRKLILAEKLGVGMVIVIIVILEAYFVGRSFRHSEDYHNDGKTMNNTEFGPIPSPLQVPIEIGGLVQEIPAIATPEPFEDFLVGSLKAFTTRKGFMSAVTKMPPTSRPVVVKEDAEVAISTERTIQSV